MSTMKEVCDQLCISYETLRFYCNEGLVPNVKRDRNNYRVFDKRNIDWLKSLQCLRRCGMSINEMKNYMDLCIEGKSTIPERKRLLAIQKERLLSKIDELQDCIDFIDNKQEHFDGILAGKIKYSSNLASVNDSAETALTERNSGAL